jgi:hypothetical protein
LMSNAESPEIFKFCFSVFSFSFGECISTVLECVNQVKLVSNVTCTVSSFHGK